MNNSHTSNPTFIGANLLRVEDERLLSGTAKFIDDIKLSQETLHVSFVRSPHAHAKIECISTVEALKESGVIEIYTAADFKDVPPIVADYDQEGYQLVSRPVLCIDTVRFVGDLVAMVIADDPYTALDGADKVEVDFESLPAVVSSEKSLSCDFQLHEGVRSNTAFEGHFESEGFSDSCTSAPLRLKRRIETGRVAAVSMEPRGCIAKFEAATGQLTFWSSTQVPHLVQQVLAEHLNLRTVDIRVIVPDMGGGFGLKAVVYPEEILVAKAAMLIGRPVKWIQDRYDDFLSSSKARDLTCQIEVGFDHTGKILFVEADCLMDIGAYPSLPFGSSLEANGATRNMLGPYEIRQFKYRTRAILTNKAPTGAYRGISAPVATMAIETMLDLIAQHLKIDPSAVRYRNLIRTFPYKHVLGLTYSEGCFKEMLDRALFISNYDQFRSKQRRDSSSDWREGIGVSVTTEQTGMGAARYKARGLFRIPGFESVTLKIEPDGSVYAAVSQAPCGQGSATAYTQIIADSLHIDPSQIRLVQGDTVSTGQGTGTFASRGANIVGAGLLKACDEIASRLRSLAAHDLGVDESELKLGDGACIHWKDQRVSLKRLAEIAYSRGATRPTENFKYGLEVMIYEDPPSIALAATVHVAKCKVNVKSGEINITDYTIIHDCGRMINPLIVDGQLHGALAQGLGEVIMEEIIHDSAGQPTTINLMEYEIPRASDMMMPLTLEAMHSQEGSKVFKGVGESATIGSVPALTSAIRDALIDTGVDICKIPLPASHLSQMIRDATTTSIRADHEENVVV